MRHHLFEFEDLAWIPDRIRDLGTDWLRTAADRTRLYEPAVPKLADLLETTKVREVVDLASGAGGGWLSILRGLDAAGHPDVKVRMSDKHPNRAAASYLEAASGGRISYTHDSVDALAAPWEGSQTRSMLFGLHHFRPDAARRLLLTAATSGAPIAIFDAPGLSLARRIPSALLPVLVPLALLGNLFFPIAVLLLTPFVRPFRWERLLLTYLLPIVPLYVWWDATVSALRAYSLAELRRLADEAGGADVYIWDIGSIGGRGPLGLNYLIGRPVASAEG